MMGEWDWAVVVLILAVAAGVLTLLGEDEGGGL